MPLWKRSEMAIWHGATGIVVALALGCSPAEDGALSPGEFASSEGLERVASELLDDPDRMRRMRGLVSLLEQLPGRRFEELAQVIQARVVIPRQEDLGLIMHAWARQDTEAAFAQALAWHRQGVPWAEATVQHAASEVIFVWAQDPSADFGAAVADAPADLRALLMISAVRGLVRSGQIPRATEMLRKEPQNFGQLLVIILAERLVEDEGVDSAIAWAEAVEGPLRVHAFRKTAGVVARRDAEKAAEWAMAHSGAPYSTGMARSVGQEWARRGDPREVMEWVDTFPDEAERRMAATWVFQDWHRREREVAMLWLQSRKPLEVMYRPVLAMHVRGLLSRGPGLAIDWIDGLADPDRQRDTQLALAKVWLEQDREAAQDWIREVGLEDAVAEAESGWEARRSRGERSRVGDANGAS